MSKISPVVLSELDFALLVPSLPHDVNKYSRGTVAVIGGSSAYPGAPILASLAASRCGAGYVRLVTSREASVCARTHLVSIPVTGCTSGNEGTLCEASSKEAVNAIGKSNVIVMGPGMGTGADVEAFMGSFRTDKPVVLDADALNVLAKQGLALDGIATGDRVLTPHEGEAARLLGRAVGDRADDAAELASRYKATVVLKGPDTLVASPDGGLRLIQAGGPELAKAGTGDVLAGMIGAFLCQRMSAADACSLAVYVHGCAGKSVARKISAHALMPEDIISEIGSTILSLEERASRGR